MTVYLADGYFTVGGTQFPITTALSNPLLLDADPSLYYMTEYYQGVMNLHIEPRWNTAIVQAGLADLDGYLPAEVLPYPPFRSGLSPQNTWRFPLLAVYPKGSDYNFKTVALYTVMRRFELVFVLPPLSSEQYEYLHPFLQAVEKTIVDRTLQGFDSNLNGGFLYWAAAGLERISVVSSIIGDVHIQNSGLPFPGITMQLDVWEQRTPDTRGFPDLAGFDNIVSTNTVGPDGYTLVQQKIDL